MHPQKNKRNKIVRTPKAVCFIKDYPLITLHNLLLQTPKKDRVIVKSSKVIRFIAYKETTDRVTRFYYVPQIAFKMGKLRKTRENGNIPDNYYVGEYSKIKITPKGIVLGKKIFDDGTTQIVRVDLSPLNFTSQHSENESTNLDDLWETAVELRKIKIKFKWFGITSTTKLSIP